MNHVIEHCGNFSPEVLEGMIGYGRETDKGRGKIGGSNQLPAGDGYATREADILLGGFIQRHAAQRAAYEEESLSEMDVQEKERLACRVAREHLEKYGSSGNEHYGHWMVRARAFANRHHIELLSRGNRESDHEYFRRVRKWIKEQPENHPSQGDFSRKWPELKRAAGTHLVFSPDPKVWQGIRSMGMDERLFLKTVATQTMKDFSDWRRKQVGTGHSLGWVAGTHVRDNGADRHPHIHLVVLKRDEAGREVDWSVSCLKGRQGKTDPDPMKELKRVFGKNVEKHLERMVGKENMPSQENTCLAEAISSSQRRDRARENRPRHHAPHREFGSSLRSLAHGLQAVEAAMQANRQHSTPDPWDQVARDIGTMMRFVAAVQETMEYSRERRRRMEAQVGNSPGIEPDLPAPTKQYQQQPGEKDDLLRKESLFAKFIRERSRYIPPPSPDQGPELEPDF